ncbi:MAG TPA: response regulator transcription factor [Solirubrobacterales bacterium]
MILREHGYESLVAADATTAIGRSAASHPAAAIVDLRGGGEDGVELTSRLRVADRLLPILVVGGEDDAERGIEALRAGADHLSLRPFGASELIARLDALLRRAGRPPPDSSLLSCDGLQVDFVGRVVMIEDESVRLTRVEFELLRILVEHRGQAVPHRSLLVEIWGREHADDRPLLRSHVSNLRRKTEPPGECRRIRTEPDVGYRFGS